MSEHNKDATSDTPPKRKTGLPHTPQEALKYPKGTVFYCKICGEGKSDEYSSLEEVEAHKREAHRSVPDESVITLLFKFVNDDTLEHPCKESEAEKIFDDLINTTMDWLVLDNDVQTHLNKFNIISVEVE